MGRAFDIEGRNGPGSGGKWKQRVSVNPRADVAWDGQNMAIEIEIGMTWRVLE